MDLSVKSYDYIIIGGGAAGLASAQYAARGGLSVAVIDELGAGGQVLQITELENYPGIFPAETGADLIERMKAQAIAFGAEIIFKNVTAIDKVGENFCVKTSGEVYQSKALCIATGAVHRNLEIPGEKEFTGRGVSYCATCDGPFFKNKKIVVIGGGDSACSEAVYLSTVSDDVTIIHRRNSFRAQKAVVDKMFERGVKAIMNTVPKQILGNAKVTGIELEDVKTGETFIQEADGIFIFTGMLPQTSLVEMIEKDEGGYIMTDEKMMTKIPGLFAAGDVRAKPFRQIVTAVSDGAIAAHSAAEFLGK